jgi:hypothetical protein
MALPSGTPLTLQVTLGLDVPVTEAVKPVRWPTGMDMVGGETVTETGEGLTRVTIALAVACETAAAWMVTGFVEGTTAGAV